MASARSDDADAERPAPFREQIPLTRMDKRYYGYISGVGAGKTFAGVYRTWLNAELWNRGEMGAIIAPTTTMIKDVIIPVMREMGVLDTWEYKSAHTDEPGLHTPSGGRLLLLSADNRRTIERLAGLNLAYYWIDEGSRVPARAHEILSQRLRAGQYRNGYVTTTPMGRDHVYDFFVGNHDGQWQSYGEGELYEAADRLAMTRVPTWANPHTPDDYKEQMEQKEGQTYEREILGRFVDFEGLVYQWFDPERHVTTPDGIEANIRQHFYGVDWGFNNPSVVLACGQTTRDELVVLEEVYQPRMTDDDLAQAAATLQERHGVGPFYCDPSEPGSIETLQRHGLDAVGADNDVQPGIKHVTAQRERFRVVDDCQNLINEFGMYRYPDDGAGGEKPVQANDHALDALRYALYTHHQRGGLSTGMEGMDFI